MNTRESFKLKRRFLRPYNPESLILSIPRISGPGLGAVKYLAVTL